MKDNKLNVSKKNLVRCDKCNSYNIVTAKKCSNCGEKLNGSISCPRCAKVNNKNAKKCVNCNYKFGNRKKKNILALIFSILLFIVLAVLLVFGKSEIVNNFTNTFRIVAIVLLLLIVISSFNYGRKEKVDYEAMYDASSKTFPKARSIAMIVISFIILIIIGVIVYFLYFK